LNFATGPPKVLKVGWAIALEQAKGEGGLSEGLCT